MKTRLKRWKTLGYKCKSFDAHPDPFSSATASLSLSLLLQHAHLGECNAVHCRHNTVFYATNSVGSGSGNSSSSRRHFFSPSNEILRIRPVDLLLSRFPTTFPPTTSFARRFNFTANEQSEENEKMRRGKTRGGEGCLGVGKRKAGGVARSGDATCAK